jgi:hypothetical protein
MFLKETIAHAVDKFYWRWFFMRKIALLFIGILAFVLCSCGPIQIPATSQPKFNFDFSFDPSDAATEAAKGLFDVWETYVIAQVDVAKQQIVAAAQATPEAKPTSFFGVVTQTYDDASFYPSEIGNQKVVFFSGIWLVAVQPDKVVFNYDELKAKNLEVKYASDIVSDWVIAFGPTGTEEITIVFGPVN